MATSVAEELLERVTQRELLYTRRCECAAIDAHRGIGRQHIERVVGIGIEPHRIGRVEDIPGKAQLVLSPKMPGLGDRAVDAEETVAPEVVAGAGFSGIGLAPGVAGGDGILQSSWIGKGGRGAIRVEVPVHLDRSGLHHVAAEVPVRGPAYSILNTEGETAGPAHQAGELLAAN